MSQIDVSPGLRRSYDFLLKLLLIGDAGVGKPAILARYADDCFNSTFISTIGIDFKIRNIELEGKRVKLQIWDTYGQERFRTITTAYYRGAQGILLVYDITNEKSFNNISKWLQDIELNASPNVEKVLVGNNARMEESRVVSKERGEFLAEEHNMPFFEVSTETNTNIEEAFETLVRLILPRLMTPNVETINKDDENIISLRFLVIGDSCCGKSSILLTYCYNGDGFTDQKPEFITKSVYLGNKQIEIWATSRPEQVTYQDVTGIILVYDITCQKSFDNITKWLQNIKEHASPDVQCILVGNKLDKDSERQIAIEMGEELATLLKIPFFETSAKENVNIAEVFETLARHVLKKEEPSFLKSLAKRFRVKKPFPIDLLKPTSSALKTSIKKMELFEAMSNELSQKTSESENSAGDVLHLSSMTSSDNYQTLQEERAISVQKAQYSVQKLQPYVIPYHKLQEKEKEIECLKEQLDATSKELQQAHDDMQDLQQQLQESTTVCQQTQQANASLQRQLQQLQEQTHWVVRREEIEMTEEILGKGGWGEVKIAKFRGLRVAAKCLHEVILSQYNISIFTREMEIAARVRHPNLLQFIGATRVGCPIILSELMPTSLRNELEKSPLTRPQIIKITRDISAALNYLHLFQPHPILHRDVSSPNILLELSGTGLWKAKLSDYGSANLAQSISALSVAPGNPFYSAPEAPFPDHHSPAMDVFSFGVLLMEMILCEPPASKTADKITQSETIQWLAMKQLVQKCITYEYKKRPSIAEVLADIECVKFSQKL